MVNTPEAYAGQQAPLRRPCARAARRTATRPSTLTSRNCTSRWARRWRPGQVLGLADHTGNVFGDPPDHLHLTLKHAGESAPGYPSNIIDPTPFLQPLLHAGGWRGASLGAWRRVQRRVAEKLGLNCNAPVDGSGNITPRLAAPEADQGDRRRLGAAQLHRAALCRPRRPAVDRHLPPDHRRSARPGAADLRPDRRRGGQRAIRATSFAIRRLPASVDNEWIRTYAQNFRQIVELFGRDVPVVESFNEPNDWHRTPRRSDPVGAGLDRSGLVRHHAPARLRGRARSGRDAGLRSAALDRATATTLRPICRKVYQAGIERFGWGRPDTPVPFDGVGFHPYVGDAIPTTRRPRSRRATASTWPRCAT